MLFQLYVNGMQNSYQILKFINFVNNTTVFANGLNMNTMYDVLVAEVTRDGYWLLANRLYSNKDNASYIIVKNKKM